MSRTKQPSHGKTSSLSKKRTRRRKLGAAGTKPAHIIEILFQNEVTPNRYDDSAAADAEKGVRPGGLLMRDIRGWRVAESLQRLLAQVNQMAPSRTKRAMGRSAIRAIKAATRTITPGS